MNREPDIRKDIVETLMGLLDKHQYRKFLHGLTELSIHEVPESAYRSAIDLLNHRSKKIREEAEKALSAIGYF